jgi:hypothetical protein
MIYNKDLSLNRNIYIKYQNDIHNPNSIAAFGFTELPNCIGTLESD